MAKWLEICYIWPKDQLNRKIHLTWSLTLVFFLCLRQFKNTSRLNFFTEINKDTLRLQYYYVPYNNSFSVIYFPHTIFSRLKLANKLIHRLFKIKPVLGVTFFEIFLFLTSVAKMEKMYAENEVDFYKYRQK